MANLEHLETLGMRAYELGRLRRASRIALLLVPLVVACLAEPRERQACASLGALLLGGCIWMRWRSRQGSDIASVGLLAGSIPLLLGVAQSALGVECDEGLPELSCLVLCALGGVAGGVLIARRAPAWRTGHDSIQKDHAITLEQAAAMVGRMCDGELRAFFQMERQLPVLCKTWPRDRDAFLAYADVLRRWMRGLLDWSARSDRYLRLEVDMSLQSELTIREAASRSRPACRALEAGLATSPSAGQGSRG